MFKGEKVLMEELLLAKEKRVAYHEHLIQEYQGVVISYQLNIPGPVKINQMITQIFETGLDTWKLELSKINLLPIVEHVTYDVTGPEYFAVLKVPPFQIKELTTLIEETH